MSSKISVALCTYNGEKFIEQQLKSIFNQSLAVSEIIICDDASTDKTVDIISKFELKYPTIIQLYKNEINLNCVKNFEKAIQLTTGDYIFLSDQDDVWQADKVEKTINYFLQNPTAEGVFTDAFLIDDNNKRIENYSLLQCCIFNAEMLEQCGSFWNTYQQYNNMVTGATLCIKKVVKEFIFPFPVIPQFYHDEWIALHLAKRNTLQLLNEKLISYRIHQQQQVGTGIIERYQAQKEYADIVMGIKKVNRFNDIFIVYKKVYSLYDKYYRVMQYDDGKKFDFESLAKGTAQNLKLLQKKMIIQFPFNAVPKIIWDKIRNKRQVHKI
jgi:glycosyltransferase involved in cell wall biosynthesis